MHEMAFASVLTDSVHRIGNAELYPLGVREMQQFIEVFIVLQNQDQRDTEIMLHHLR